MEEIGLSRPFHAAVCYLFTHLNGLIQLHDLPGAYLKKSGNAIILQSARANSISHSAYKIATVRTFNGDRCRSQGRGPDGRHKDPVQAR